MKAIGEYLASMNRNFARSTLVAVLLALCVSSFAQYRGGDRGNDQDVYEGTAGAMNAGGNWMQYSSEDRMTAAKRVRFELRADNAPKSDPSARVILYCTNGKLTLADFHPGDRLSRPNWPGFWGQPQMRVRVRVNDSASDHSWNWIRGHFLAMDKGTARELIGAHLLRIEFSTPQGPQIAEFSPAGLDLGEVKHACDLTPKKP
ncbi:MAG: hypothetical protein J2P13_09075 [Acidobacteria bacterium]|nr:hypothetical protein [Acidobacteriota bacterium]